MNKKQKLVVVGCGMASGKFIEEIISHDREKFDITVIGNEEHGNYNRIKLVNMLYSDSVDDVFIQTPEYFKDNNVNALLGVEVTAIDHLKKMILLADQTLIPYDKLVIATGSNPFMPGVDGIDLPGVMVIRTMNDVEKAKSYLKDRTEVLVVGGGLLGLELALGLKKMGKHIMVAHLVDSLMEFQLCKDAASYLQKKMEEKGLQFFMENPVARLTGDETGVRKAVLKNGIEISVEAVFFNCGIKPNIKLAADAGLRVNRGIMVDDTLKTSDNDIYAIGECCEHRGRIYGLVAPVWDQARFLASILLGDNVFYAGSEIPPTRLKSDFPVITMGRFNEHIGDETAIFEDKNSLVYKKLIIRDNKIIGANLVGEDLNADGISLSYTAKLPIPSRRADILFPGATTSETIMDASSWPDDAPICDCNGVNAGKIRKSIKHGADTVSKVMGATRAGTGCGNCKNKLKALLISETGELKDDPSERYYVPGIPLAREELNEYILQNSYRSVSSILRSFGDKAVNDPKTRMGLDYLLNYIWKGDYEIEYDSKPANDRYHGNIQKDGTFSVIPRVHGGVADPDSLAKIANVAKEYNLTVKITGADRIGLYSVKKEDLDDVWKKLGCECGYAYAKTFRAAKSCVGTEFCRFGVGDSMTLGKEMCDRYHGMTGPAKFKMGISGCPRNCAEATIKDFGIVAVEGGWDIFIGGNGGAQVMVAKKIARVKTHGEVMKIADRFYEYYRLHGKYLERTSHFVERVGVEKIADAILYDTPDKLKKLEDDFSRAISNIKNPWNNHRDLVDDKDACEIEALKDGWLTVLRLDDLSAGESRLVRTSRGEFAVFHTRDGKWIATEPKCPHEKGPIVDSIYGSGRLHCPIHNYSFDIKSGKSNSDEIGSLKIYETKIDGDKLLVFH
ncbi:MAG: nitrite reductase large subunit NirB [Victivallales bacterium]